jgi:hypothetical protein
METEPASETPFFFKKLDNRQKSQKRKICQLTSVVFCSLFLIYVPLKMGVTACPKTSVRNYHSMLCNIPEERRFHRMWECRPWFGSAWSGSE